MTHFSIKKKLTNVLHFQLEAADPSHPMFKLVDVDRAFCLQQQLDLTTIRYNFILQQTRRLRQRKSLLSLYRADVLRLIVARFCVVVDRLCCC